MSKLKLTDEMINDADEVIRIKSISELTLKNIALQIATASLNHNGFYGCTKAETGVKVLYILEPEIISQVDFYNLPEVAEQLEIQKKNPPWSEESINAQRVKLEIAEQHGVADKFETIEQYIESASL